MLLVVAPLVVLAAALAWAAGLRRAAVVGGAAVLVLLVLGSVAGRVAGAQGEADDDDREDPVTPALVLAPTETEPRVREPDVVVALPADPFDAPAALDALERLEDGDVRLVEVAVEGRVTLHQCRAGTVTADGCAAGFVAHGVDGPPTALVELRTRIETPAGPVDCTTSACILAVFEGPEVILDVPLVFGGPSRPQPRLTVRPATGVRAGQDVTVTVTVDGLAPGAGGGLVAFCTAAEGATRARCVEDVAVELSPPAAPSGAAAATLRLAGCPRTDRCAVRVAVEGAPLAYAELGFASPPGADPGGGQLAGGLAAAGALFIAAMVLVRRTDWTNPDGDPFTDIEVGHDDPFAGIDLDVDEYGDPWS